MYGWCEKCESIALDGLCSIHGKTKPISTINSIDIHPLTQFEKNFLNKRLRGLKLGNGLFAIYGDRAYHRKVVTLDRPLVEVKMRKNKIYVKSLTRGKINGMSIDSLIATNKKRTNWLTGVAKTFARWELESNGRAIISFSGGKDSVVLSHLLRKFKLKNVFIDTGIEFPETCEFVKQSQKDGLEIDIARAETNFFKLCKEKGYPSFYKRWCCKTQKFEPFSKYINEHFGNNPVTVFSGERRWEALSRIDQPMKKKHKYITNQDTVQLLLDWLALDIWIYIWRHKLPINKVYNYFDRSGCWVCPFGLRYRIMLLRHTHPKHYKILQKIRENNGLA
jgi:3'-phosphoadenosine 5'-phosphosulfate sulfotransferase (PAPS reductase)/FAD synthetase